MVVETAKENRWNGIMKVTYLFPESTPEFVDRLRVSVERNIGKYEIRICHKEIYVQIPYGRIETFTSVL